MDKYIGKRLDGRYEITQLVGVGGMANVYKATDLVENRLVAVKVLRDEFMDNEEFLRRFRNESKAVASLSHENIVKVYDVSFSQKMHSIVMEYIEGDTLKEYIDQRGKLSWKETVDYTEQILHALQHAHDNGIVHRDIKPQNIMRLPSGTVKVTDFGIARFARSITKTITDRAIGSVHYISPEQAQGGTIDEKTDIYSVGVMMYEMLTGRLPFDADSPVTVALKQIQSEPPRPGSINPEIPEGLEMITMRAMQKDSTRRYQSAAEMLRDIDDFKKNPSIDFAYKYLAVPDADKQEHPAKPAKSPLAASLAKFGRKKSEEGEALSPNGQRSIAKEKNRRKKEDEGYMPYDEEEEEERPRIPFLSVLTGITVAFVLVSAIFVGTMFYFNNPFKTVESIKVPNLVGKKFDTVKYDNTLTEQGINVRVEQTEFNSKFENGVIFEQNPKSGRDMKSGSIIQVKVSAGAQKSTMMDLAGMEANEAYALLKTKGLENYNEIRINDDGVPEGHVVKTDPEPNTQVEAQTEIQVYVSMGRKNQLLAVPDIQGINITEAKRLLKNYRLSIGNITTRKDQLGIGVIISQSPQSGAEVPEGSAIDVVISEGDGETSKLSITITLPNLSEPVTVEAWLDDAMVHEDKLTPADLEGQGWKQIYEGAGELPLDIRINGKLYQSFEVSFSEERHRLITDNSALFQSGVPSNLPDEEAAPAAGDASAEAPENTSSQSEAQPDDEFNVGQPDEE